MLTTRDKIFRLTSVKIENDADWGKGLTTFFKNGGFVKRMVEINWVMNRKELYITPNMVDYKMYVLSMDSDSNHVVENYKQYASANNEIVNLAVHEDGVINNIHFLALNEFSDFLKTKNIDMFERNIISLYEKIEEERGSAETYSVIYHVNLSLYDIGRISSWISDAYLYVGEFDKAWNFLRDKKRISTTSPFINIKARCQHASITATEFLSINGVNKDKLTSYGAERFRDIVTMLEIKLNDFELEHNANIVQYYFERWQEKDVSVFQPYAKEALSKRKLYSGEISLLNHIGKYTTKKLPLFHRCMGIYFADEWIYPNYIFDDFFGIISQTLLRDIENILREESGIPLIGEGWISETRLYYLVKEAFPGEEVVHHGKPQWLGRQHLDIYFPYKNIALEYQGKQHDEPIGYFGGEDAYKQQKKRDKIKKSKCEKNGCYLIYVREGYNADEIIATIQNLLIMNNCTESTDCEIEL